MKGRIHGANLKGLMLALVLSAAAISGCTRYNFKSRVDGSMEDGPWDGIYTAPHTQDLSFVPAAKSDELPLVGSAATPTLESNIDLVFEELLGSLYSLEVQLGETGSWDVSSPVDR